MGGLGWGVWFGLDFTVDAFPFAGQGKNPRGLGGGFVEKIERVSHFPSPECCSSCFSSPSALRPADKTTGRVFNAGVVGLAS